MPDPIASRLRKVMRHVERVNRRVALADIPGKVIAGSQVYDGERTLRLDIGRSASGAVIKSPKVKWQQPGAGKFKVHAPPKDDEQMRLRSPSGTVGTGSLADWSTYDKDNAPPSTDGDETVLEFGEKAKITMREDSLVISLGGDTITMTGSNITLKSPKIDLNP